jgi:hypothetical protein
MHLLHIDSCIKAYERPGDGSKVEPKHEAVDKPTKLKLYATDLIHVIW